MGILSRFADIIKANINELLDKAEDPAKMCDQYIREMTEDLAEVKQETAGVMAEEQRAKRLYEENAKQVQKYQELAVKAIQAGNDGDARVFIAKKQELESVGQSLKQAYDVAAANSEKMRQLHDKLTQDINTLKQRREAVKAKSAVAKTQTTINKYSAAADRTASTMDAFARMEEKADRALDIANAEAELNDSAVDEAEKLEKKYGACSDASVEEELAAMKAALGM